ncbi:unnamed protein product [Rotaria sordida]|uniref:Uncharacterized protein n=1 Tax=Rotaria sordida TaxID=392033 RepID=A0A815VE15_9BILA|nr:unnamed protein product [Rotaria sordida]
MASTTTTISGITVENLVKCAICLDFYNDPRYLPCSHTFCYQCIEKLCTEGIGQCPMRDNTFIRRSIINNLPVNRIAKDLVECIYKSSSSSQTKCDHCKKILSEFICETCSKHFCTICLKLEHDINQFKTHSINIIINENFNQFCPEHIEEKQKYWCNRCQIPVCSDCLLFKHKHHSFITLDNISQTMKIQLHSSAQQLNSTKEILEKLNKKTTEAYHTHYQTHIKIKNHIEQTINQLQALLEERKKYLISTVTKNDAVQQEIIQTQKSNIEDHLKAILIRQLFTKQILKTEDLFQLVKMKNDVINYNQLIQEQCDQLMYGCIFDLQHFTIDSNLSRIQRTLEDLGSLSTETFLTNSVDIRPLLKLSESYGEEKYQEFQGIYAYGYRLHLSVPLTINAILVKVASFNSDLTIYILDHSDVLVQKETIKTSDKHLTTLTWITIPITFQLQHNYYIFVWAQPNAESLSSIAYRDSTHNLRQINQHVSVRSKSAQINKLTNIDINTKINVLYDAFLFDDERNPTVPAIEMILDI